MINIDTMIKKEIENGYGDANAQAKVCQDINQEEYCFVIAFDDEGASLLINTNEQMIAEKLSRCLSIYIFDDPAMREKDIGGVYNRISMVFKDRMYLSNLRSRDANWLGEDVDVVPKGILDYIRSFEVYDKFGYILGTPENEL